LRAARTLLLIPDLIGYWLTGEAAAEVTNASTTQLLDVRAQAWATGLMERTGIPAGIFPPLRAVIRPMVAGAAIQNRSPPGTPAAPGRRR
jgi:sugar (pentulose or hexulose) kinase